MSVPARVAVLGGGGFVGSAVIRALAARPDTLPVRIAAPRLISASRDAVALVAEARRLPSGAPLPGFDVVVNAAGDPDASGTDLDRLVGANALMPVVALFRAVRGGARRFVHVSSVAVQGRAEVLDESDRHDPFSPYATSKCLGEEALTLASSDAMELVLYRPPSVHAADRRVTRRVAAVAQSPLRSVAGAGRRPSPQALVENVGAAVAQLCTAPDPPRVVIHPWEGLTTAALLQLLGGGRTPRRVPEPIARLALWGARATVGRLPHRGADVRRVEMLWFGQPQTKSWLTTQGWSPPVGAEGWRRLAERVSSGEARGARR